jgi:ABC-type dipeptide/oligopeptide/nickel transport system permease component
MVLSSILVILDTLFNYEGVGKMLEDHDIKDRQVHAHLQPVVLGILACYVVIMAVGYWVGNLF